MTRTMRRFIAVLIAALALLGIFATAAYAALEDTPTPVLATSETNPGWGVDHWWRGDWGNSVYPEFSLVPPSMDEATDGYVAGFLYSVDKNGASIINTATPQNYYRAAWPAAIGPVGGTATDHTIDLLGIWMNPPAGGWPVQPPSQHTPLEGWWHFHYLLFSNLRYSTAQWNLGFGFDQTPPRAVTHLKVTTGLTSSAVTTWTPATRAHITWDAGDAPGQYDDLAGIGYYQVNVDDKPYVGESSVTPTQGRVYGSTSFVIPPTFDIENMPAGAHKISIVPVDRATNEGPATSQWFYSDPDTPTISITSPLTGTLSNKTIFAFDANDAAGPPVVTVSLDSTAVATITAPPYSFKPDLTGLGNGMHTLKAVATDHLGRTAVATKTVSFTNTSLSSGFTIVGPSEFTYVVPAGSASNPPGDPWRWDPLDHTKIWTNSLHPDFTLPVGSEVASLATDTDGKVAGMLYDVRRAPALIDASVPDAYFRSWRPLSAVWQSTFDSTIDLQSTMAYPPAGGWPAAEPGAEQPVEGTWYYEYKGFLDSGWAESDTNVVKFGVDVTPPSIVESLAASPATDTATGGGVSAGTRMHVIWRTRDYDSLSGVAYYQVFLDGSDAVPGAEDDQGRVFDMAGRAEPAVTLENLTAGKHTIQVCAVDRAGNVGKAASVVVYSDPDTPTVSITSPSSSAIGVHPTVAASAADLGGVASVIFKLDGHTLLTDTEAPYAGRVDLSAYSSGVHALTATVTDRYGRQTTATKSVTLDTTPLTISSVKATGKGRKITVAFNVNRASTTRFFLSVGGTPRSPIVASKSGRYSFSFTYPRTGDYPSSVSFYDRYSLVASDALGNVTTKTGKVKVTFMKIVKLSGNKVKIIRY